MARRKNLTSYPEEYFKLFEHAASTEITITLESFKQARSLRNELYTFRSVLYETPGAYYTELKNAALNVRISLQDSKIILEPIKEE